MVLATTCFLFVNHLFKANAIEVLLKTLRLSTIGKSKGLNHHAEKPEKTNKQTKNEHDRSKNKNIKTKLLELKRKKPKTSKCNETENLVLRLIFCIMRTLLTVPLSLRSRFIQCKHILPFHYHRCHLECHMPLPKCGSMYLEYAEHI